MSLSKKSSIGSQYEIYTFTVKTKKTDYSRVYFSPGKRVKFKLSIAKKSDGVLDVIQVNSVFIAEELFKV